MEVVVVLKIWLVIFSFFSLVKAPGIGVDANLSMEIEAWKFMQGDNALYATVGYDDQAWSPINVPGYWEQNGHPGYDGIGWYRVSLYIPKSWNKRSGFILNLGLIDDNDETYVNGQLVGSTAGYKIDRKYLIPKSLIKFGGNNVISVKVIDNGGDGGIYGSAPVLGTGQSVPEFNADKY